MLTTTLESAVGGASAPVGGMIARLTRILDAFDAPHSVLSLEDVTSRAGLPTSTTHRIIVQLMKSRWLQHLPGEGYRLGTRAFQFRGSHSSSHDDLRRLAVEPLRMLHLQTGLVAHLSVLDGPDVLLLDKIGGSGAALVPSRVGGRHAPHISPGGRAMLAGLPAEAVDGFTDRRAFGKTSGWTPRSLYQELGRIRQRRGLSIDDTGRYSQGIASVAASLDLPGLPRASICLSLAKPGDALRVVPAISSTVRAVETAAKTAAFSAAAPGGSGVV